MQVYRKSKGSIWELIIIKENVILTETLKKIDLTPTQYMKIQQSYEALAKEFEKADNIVEIYTQGSIRLGTTIKPFRKMKDVDYDVDLVVEYQNDKKTISAKELKENSYEVLSSNQLYSEKLEEKKRCWRIQYSENNGLAFHADILPSVKEDSEIINQINVEAAYEDLKKHSLAITKKEKNDYSWNQSNPKGYAGWFEKINVSDTDLFKKRKKIILTENVKLFESIEDIPDALVKTSLQRVIQILKRHRDVYFSNSRNEEKKPISIIITTIVTEIVCKKKISALNFSEMLREVASLMTNSRILLEKADERSNELEMIIYKEGGQWFIPNPVNNKENFADKWNNDANLPKTFYEWLDAVYNDIVANYNNPDFAKILCKKLEIPYDEEINGKHNFTANSSTIRQPWRN